MQQRLLGLAYQMTGEAAASQDICQDVWLRYWERQQHTTIVYPSAYLRRMVINASLDYLNAVQAQRAAYKGSWLPEPLLQAPSHSHLDLAYGITVVLTHLNPKERAVFLLRTCFDYRYAEIADLLQLSVANCRKIYQRVAPKISRKANTPIPPTKQENKLLPVFLKAVETGDLQAFVQLLQEDVVLYSDGGGKVSAATKPLYGKAVCQAFLQGIAKKTAGKLELHPAWINQQWGFLLYEDKHLTTILLSDWTAAGIQHIYLLRNPDKFPLPTQKLNKSTKK